MENDRSLEEVKKQTSFPLLQAPMEVKLPYDDNVMVARYLSFLEENGLDSTFGNNVDCETSEYSSDEYDYSTDEINELRKMIYSSFEEDTEEGPKKKNHKQKHLVVALSESHQYERGVSDTNVLKESSNLHLGTEPVLRLARSQITCNICQQQFSNRIKLNRHRKKHHASSNAHKCQVCENRYVKANDLKRHCKEKHPTSNFYQKLIDECKVELRHKSLPVSCKVCQRKFKTKNMLKRHSSVHDPSKPFVCEVCPCRYSAISSLRCHYTKMHPLTAVSIRECVSTDQKLRHLKKPRQEPKVAAKPKFKEHSSFHDHKTRLNFKNCVDKFNGTLSLPCLDTQQKQKTCEACEKSCYFEGHMKLHRKLGLPTTIESDQSTLKCLDGVEFGRHVDLKPPNFKSWFSDQVAEVHEKNACPICWQNFDDKTQQICHVKTHFSRIEDARRYKQYFDPSVVVSSVDSLVDLPAKKKRFR